MEKDVSRVKWTLRAALLAPLCSVLGASVAGEGAFHAESDRLAEKVNAAISQARTDPSRPAYHFRPPALWMNDICGAIQYHGVYHIFYQLNPHNADIWGADGSCWGHARSNDLVHWTHLPIALTPMTDRGEQRCNSGSVVLNGAGSPMIFYTFVPSRPDATQFGKREQWGALPLDPGLLRWRRVAENPLLAAGKDGVPNDVNSGWSDPFVFTASGRKFMTLKSCDGLICESEDEALARWKCVGRIEGVEGECPNVIEVDGRWALLRSTSPPTWLAGLFDPENVSFHADGPAQILDHAYGDEPPEDRVMPRGFYGSNAFTDDKGRCILLGWISGFKAGRGWNGCMSLPRVLTFDKRGLLVQTPARELEALRGDHFVIKDSVLEEGARIVQGASGRQIEVAVSLSAGGARASGLRLCASGDGLHGVTLRWSDGVLDVDGTAVRISEAERRHLDLRLFLDRSVLEVFADGGRKVVTRVVYPEADCDQIALFAEGGDACLDSLEVWQMQSIWNDHNADRLPLLPAPNAAEESLGR